VPVRRHWLTSNQTSQWHPRGHFYKDYAAGKLAGVKNRQKAINRIDAFRQELLSGKLKVNQADETAPC
jgi:hypothetical protein